MMDSSAKFEENPSKSSAVYKRKKYYRPYRKDQHDKSIIEPTKFLYPNICITALALIK